MSSPRPRIGVLQFPGSNDDRDALWALAALDAEAVPVWHAETELPDLEAVVKVCGDLLNSEHGGARRRQLDRQRDAVEPAAARRDHRCCAFVRRNMRLRRAQPFDK